MVTKIPPYGKSLFELQKKGLKPNNSVYVWIGLNAWIKGRVFSNSMPNRTLVLPPWESAIKYDWPVKDCDVLIQASPYADQDYIEETVYYLYKHDAEIVRAVSGDFTLTVYHKE